MEAPDNALASGGCKRSAVVASLAQLADSKRSRVDADEETLQSCLV